MADPSELAARSQPVAKRPLQWRAWMRAIHRDLGYLVVGLVVVYSASGIAVNHVADWDPNFVNFERTHELGATLTGSDEEIAGSVLKDLGIEGRPTDVYRAAPDQLDVILDARTLHVNPLTGRVIDEGQSARPLLRAANWLHLNRGKKGWTFIADAFAAGLVLLALSGMTLIPGRKGIKRRGAVLVLAGVLVPVVYVLWSGGP